MWKAVQTGCLWAFFMPLARRGHLQGDHRSSELKSAGAGWGLDVPDFLQPTCAGPGVCLGTWEPQDLSLYSLRQLSSVFRVMLCERLMDFLPKSFLKYMQEKHELCLCNFHRVNIFKKGMPYGKRPSPESLDVGISRNDYY